MSLAESFLLESYIQITSGLTSPSELLSNEITISGLTSEPVAVSMPLGTIILNGVDVGNTASVSNTDTFQLKVTNPVIGQTTNYNYTIAGILTLQWTVTLFASETQNAEATSTGGTQDTESYDLPADIPDPNLSEENVPNTDVSTQTVVTDVVGDTVSESVATVDTITDVVQVLKTSLEQQVTQALTLQLNQSAIAAVKDEVERSDLFDKQQIIVELTEILNVEKLMEIIEPTLVDENIRAAIISTDILKEATQNLPEQVIDTIVTELKETVTQELSEIVESKQTEIIEIIEKATVNAIDAFAETDVLTVIEKLVTEETENIDLGALESGELTEIESVFGQVFFSALENDAVNEINLTELTVNEFLANVGISEFVEKVATTTKNVIAETISEDVFVQTLAFIVEKEDVFNKTIIAPIIVEEVKLQNLGETVILEELGLVNLGELNLIDEFASIPVGEQTEFLEGILREFVSEVLAPAVSEITETTPEILVGEEETVDENITITASTEETSEENVVTNVPTDPTTEEQVVVNVPTDSAPEEESPTVVVSGEEIEQTGAGIDSQEVSGGTSKGVIRLRDGVLTFYHLRPIIVLGEITGLFSTIGPFIDREGTSRSMKL